MLVFAGLLLSAGALGDRFGRRGALTPGSSSSAPVRWRRHGVDSASMLIAARAFMGIGGALIMPATLSILTNVFTDRTSGPRPSAMWASVGGLAVAIGPVVGGWLLEHFSWSSVFAINIPSSWSRSVAGRVVVPTSRDPETPPLDIPGAVLSIVGLGALVWAIIAAGEQRLDLVRAADRLRRRRRRARRLRRLGAAHARTRCWTSAFFRNPRFTAASLGVMLSFFAMFGSLFLMTQLLQFVLGYSALEAGVRLLPFALVDGGVRHASARSSSSGSAPRSSWPPAWRGRRRAAVGWRRWASAAPTATTCRRCRHGCRRRPHLGPDHRVDHGLAARRPRPGSARR